MIIHPSYCSTSQVTHTSQIPNCGVRSQPYNAPLRVLCDVFWFAWHLKCLLGFQPAQEERRDEQEPEGRALGDKDGGEAEEEAAQPEPRPEAAETKAEKDLRAAQRAAKRHRNMYCKVVLLDDTIFECAVDVSTSGVCFCVSFPSPFSSP